MAYDVEGARAAGLGDAQINDYLASKYKYDLPKAREAGVWGLQKRFKSPHPPNHRNTPRQWNQRQPLA